MSFFTILFFLFLKKCQILSKNEKVSFEMKVSFFLATLKLQKNQEKNFANGRQVSFLLWDSQSVFPALKFFMKQNCCLISDGIKRVILIS